MRPAAVAAAAALPPTPARRPPAAALGLLLLLLGAASAQEQTLLISRPEGDCLAPALTSLDARNQLFPKGYQLQSLRSTAAPRASSSTGLSTTVEFAQDFSVAYYGTYKVATNRRANETYVLYQCGTPNPLAALEGAGGGAELPAGAKAFEIPLTSVAVTDSNAAGFLAELGLLDRVALASRYSYHECLQTIYGCSGDAVSPAPPADYDASAANDAKFKASLGAWEELSAAQQRRVDAVFAGEPTANPKSIAVTAFADPGALNRAEWVKFVAAFFNKEVEANALFARISNDYDALAKRAKAEAAASSGSGGATAAAWLTNDGAGVVSVNFSPYKAQLIADAGGVVTPDEAAAAAAGGARAAGAYSSLTYNFNLSAGAPPQQRAGLLRLLRGVDVIFDDSYAVGSANYADLPALYAAYGLDGGNGGADNSDVDSVPALKSGRVYAFNNRLARSSSSGSGSSGDAGDAAVSSDWFEASVARPDLALRDFVLVLTPAAAPAGAQLTWLRRLPAGDSSSGSNAAAAALTFRPASLCAAIKGCARPAPARICPNAYRDCATGELTAVSDPAERCDARTVCPPNSPAALQQQQQGGSSKSGAAVGRGGGAAAASAAALTALLGAALLALAALLA